MVQEMFIMDTTLQWGGMLVEEKWLGSKGICDRYCAMCRWGYSINRTSVEPPSFSIEVPFCDSLLVEIKLSIERPIQGSGKRSDAFASLMTCECHQIWCPLGLFDFQIRWVCSLALWFLLKSLLNSWTYQRKDREAEIEASRIRRAKNLYQYFTLATLEKEKGDKIA